GCRRRTDPGSPVPRCRSRPRSRTAPAVARPAAPGSTAPAARPPNRSPDDPSPALAPPGPWAGPLTDSVDRYSMTVNRRPGRSSVRSSVSEQPPQLADLQIAPPVALGVHVTDRLRREIVSGQIPPGTHLVEGQIGSATRRVR